MDIIFDELKPRAIQFLDSFDNPIIKNPIKSLNIIQSMGVGTGDHIRLSQNSAKDALLDVKMYIKLEKER